MVQTYAKQVNAIVWDGRQKTADCLIELYPKTIRAVIAKNNMLRMSVKRGSYPEAEYMIPVGSYIELLKYDVHVWEKIEFESSHKKAL